MNMFIWYLVVACTLLPDSTKAKEHNHRFESMLLLYKELFSMLYFLKIYNHTSLRGPTASGTSGYPTSKVCTSTMLVLPIVKC